MFREKHGLNLAFLYCLFACVAAVEIRLTVTRLSKLVLLPSNSTRFQELSTEGDCDWQVVLDGVQHIQYLEDYMFTPNEKCITSLLITNSPSIKFVMCHMINQEFTELQNLTIINNAYMFDLCIDTLPAKLQYLDIRNNRLTRLTRFPYEQKNQLIEVAADGNELNQVDFCLVDTNWYKRLNVPRDTACNCNKIKLIGQFKSPSSSANRVNLTDAAACSQWCTKNSHIGSVSDVCLCMILSETDDSYLLCNPELYEEEDSAGALSNNDEDKKSKKNNPLMFAAVGIGCAVAVAAVVVGTLKLSNRLPGVVTTPESDGPKDAVELDSLFGLRQVAQPVELIQRRPAFTLENPCHPVINLDRPNSTLDMRSMEGGLGLRQKTSEGTMYGYEELDAQFEVPKQRGRLPSHVDGSVLDMLPFKPEVEMLRNGMAVPSVEIRRPSEDSLTEPNDSILPNLQDLDRTY